MLAVALSLRCQTFASLNCLASSLVDVVRCSSKKLDYRVSDCGKSRKADRVGEGPCDSISPGSKDGCRGGAVDGRKSCYRCRCFDSGKTEGAEGAGPHAIGQHPIHGAGTVFDAGGGSDNQAG